MNLREKNIPIPDNKIFLAARALKISAIAWFVIAVLGQWIFAYYVAFFYGTSTINGNLEEWNRVLPHGYVAGETMGNLAVATHLFFAVIILIGGPLQFVPKLRSFAPSFHRWNGRIYVFTVFLVALSGLYMVWTRGVLGGPLAPYSISINALLIFLCGALGWRFAIKRNFRSHQRWMLRLFLVASGVWFFRIGLMFWLFVNGGPVGFDSESFQGPFLTFLGFAQYLLPLFVLECYFLVRDRKGISGKLLMTMVLFAFTAVTAIGIFAATAGMWLPRL